MDDDLPKGGQTFLRMRDEDEPPPEGEQSSTCKVGEISERVTWSVGQVDHDLLEQCVPIVRRNVARHQFVPWNYFVSATKSATDPWLGRRQRFLEGTSCEDERRELFGRSRPPTVGQEDQSVSWMQS